jgi:hypothetical protein
MRLNDMEEKSLPPPLPLLWCQTKNGSSPGSYHLPSQRRCDNAGSGVGVGVGVGHVEGWKRSAASYFSGRYNRRKTATGEGTARSGMLAKVKKSEFLRVAHVMWTADCFANQDDLNWSTLLSRRRVCLLTGSAYN